MEQPTLEQRVAALFDPPASVVRGGVGAESELSHAAESDLSVSAWVEMPSAGVRLDLGSDGLLRIVAYDPASRQEATISEQSIEALVRETLG